MNEIINTETKQYEFLEETKKLLGQTSIAQFILAERLHRIKEERLWQAGYESFDDYCMELKTYNSGTISKLMTIHKKFVIEYQIPQEKLAEVGWTILYKAKNVLTGKEDAEEFVDNAIIWTGSDTNREIASRKSGKDIDDCLHENTILVRICKECGQRWEQHEEHD
jgi:hypothetical protein